MPANTDAMIHAATDAIRNGKKADARALLEKVLEMDERSEQAWMWMSAAVDAPEDQRVCLENVLAINPNNQQASQGLKALGGTPTPPPAQPAYTPAFDMDTVDDFFSDMDFGGESAKPAEKSEWDSDIATSSSSALYNTPETKGEDLDDWITGMGINKGKSAPSATSSTKERYDTGNSYDDDLDDAFLRDDHSYTDTSSAKSNSFDDDFMHDFESPFASDNQFNEDEFDSYNEPPPPASPSARAYNPPITDFEEAISTSTTNDNSEDMFKDFIGDVGKDTQSKRGAPENQKTPEELFAMIPSDIATGRVPGTNEEYPNSVKVGIIIASAANVVAFTLLLLRLVG